MSSSGTGPDGDHRRLERRCGDRDSANPRLRTRHRAACGQSTGTGAVAVAVASA